MLCEDIHCGKIKRGRERETESKRECNKKK